MKTGKELALAAKKAGICDEWYRRMPKYNDIKPLCRMFFDGDDWAMENDFPSLEILRQFKGNSDSYGLHTDYDGIIECEIETGIFGNSHADIQANDYDVKKIIVRHNSILNLSASGNSIVQINVLDNAKVTVVAKDNAKVSIYRYSDSADIEASGNVSIFKSEFKAAKTVSKPI